MHHVPDICTLTAVPVAEKYSLVEELVSNFISDTVNLPHKIVYGVLPATVFDINSKAGEPQPRLTLATPVTPPDPRITFLDGLGNSLIALDPVTQTVVSQVVVPSTSGPYGIRPAITGPDNEVWVANGGLHQISVADLGIAKIASPT